MHDFASQPQRITGQILEDREKLRTDFQEPGVRDAINGILKTVSGGVLSLDAIDEHLRAEAEGRPSPLAEKLKSREVLKLIDPAGNTMEAIAREQAKREGLPEELQDKVASAAGLLAGALMPMGTGSKGAKAATTVFTNSLFSNPATHVANVTSNALTSTWAIAERLFAASWSALEYGATLGAHERTVFFGEPAAMLIGALHSSMDAIQAAGHALRTGDYPLSSIAREMERGGTVVPARQVYRYGPEGLRLVDRDLLTDGVVQQGNNFFHTVATLPTRALGAEDAAAKVVNARMEKYAMAYRQAAETGDVSLANIKQILETPNPYIDMLAQQFATAHTFQTNLESLGPFMSAMGRTLQGFQDVSLGAIPLGRLVVPVLRTPLNLAHFSLERSPGLNLLASTWRADFGAGGALRAQAMGKVTGGAVLASTAAYFANAGLISGGGPADPKLRKDMIELQGWRPYSVKLGDTWYSYDRLAPIGALLGIAADFSEIGGSLSQDRLNKLGQAIGLGASRYATSNAFTQQYADFLSAWSGDEKAMKSLLADHVSSEITPGMLRAIRKGVDPYKRETNPGADPEPGIFSELRGYITELKNQTPGWSQTLPPVRNLFGEAVMLPSGFGSSMISPVYTSTWHKDPAGDEIVRLGKAGLPVPGKPGRVILGGNPQAGAFDQPQSALNVGVELTDAEYDELQRLAGNELKVNKLGMHDHLNQMISRDPYWNASDEKRSLMIMNTVNQYRKAAEGQLLKNNPGILDTYKAQVRAMGSAVRTPRGLVVPNVSINP